MTKWIYGIKDGNGHKYSQIVECEKDELDDILEKRLNSFVEYVNRSRQQCSDHPDWGIPIAPDLNINECEIVELQPLT